VSVNKIRLKFDDVGVSLDYRIAHVVGGAIAHVVGGAKPPNNKEFGGLKNNQGG
jgi:hypothetical protein